MYSLTITRPDDWHVHFRDGQNLPDTVAATAKHFARALVMPNLKPALTSVTALLAYRERIINSLAEQVAFTPLMTLYLNETISAAELEKTKNYPFILGAKLYPAGATTNSEEGVSSLQVLYPLLELMQELDLVLQIHGEVVEGDIFDREADFISRCLLPLIRNFPRLRIVLEHISTAAAVDFIEQAPQQISATITAHHLLYNRNQLLAGGLRPHYYCLPILKRETDQQALQKAATSNNPKFFAGTDSAPHAIGNKESACGCAGIYSAPVAVALYAQIFSQLGQLDKLDSFLSRFGAEFYRQPINKTELILEKKPNQVPQVLPLGQEQVVPMAAGEILEWRVYEPI